ncbi:MAG TPA: TlpA disulfide reductase family protein [Actinomycetota bacterium]|nr:TlpA disulfide reductase family protein [Actinomycetota bacterium]
MANITEARRIAFCVVVPTEELEDYAPRSRVPKLIIVAIIALVAAFFLFRPAPEEPLPDFALTSLSGSETLTKADLRGSPVVLNFFASWCVPCRDEAPLLEQAWRDYKDKGVRFVGVNFQDTPSRARHFVEEFGITFPVVVDGEGELAKALGVYGLPQTFFVNDELQLVAANDAADTGEAGSGTGIATFGAIERAELYRRIDALIEGSGEGS